MKQVKLTGPSPKRVFNDTTPISSAQHATITRNSDSLPITYIQIHNSDSFL